MTLQEAIDHPKVNVFDIVPDGNTYNAHTYSKPNEDNVQFQIRKVRNNAWAKRLKQKGRS